MWQSNGAWLAVGDSLAEALLSAEATIVPVRTEAVQNEDSSLDVYARHSRMVVHELRNTLVPMQLALDELKRVMLSENQPVRSSQERLDRGMERAFRFLEELQKVAELGSSLQTPFALMEAIKDARATLNGGFAVDYELPSTETPPEILGDRSRFTLVLLNLFRNAAQCSDRTRVRVRISWTSNAAGERLLLSIEDDGPGVPAASREEIFRPGVSLRGGSGQGLALVRDVVQLEMKGSVRCEESELGGARFVLSLPIASEKKP